MNIVHVVRQYAPAIGGLENFVKALAEQQSQTGMSVTVITLNRSYSSGETYLEYEKINDVNVIRIPYRGSKRYPIAPKVFSHIPRDGIVHVHCTDFFSDFLAITKPFHGAKLVLSTHGGFFHTGYASSVKNIYFNTITRLSLLAYKQIFACSVGDLEKFSTITNKAVLIENGVDVNRFLKSEAIKSEGSIRFAFVGRLSSNKGLDKLVDTYTAVFNQRSSWSLVIIGNDFDGLASALNERISNNGMKEQIEIRSGLTNEELEQETLKSHFVASASEYEGFGMAVIEGMAAGMIPIVSNISSFEKIIQDSGLGLINQYRGQEDADTIIRFVESQLEDYKQLSLKARQFSERYSWISVERKFAQKYNQILGTSLRNIQGVSISNLSKNEALDMLEINLEKSIYTKLAYANAHTINLVNAQRNYSEILNDFTVLPDGIGVDIASKFKYGDKFKANLNGTDFTPEIFKRLQGKRIFILGAREGLAQCALNIWQDQYPQHSWVGSHHGYINEETSSSIAEKIKALNTDVLIVAMGNPVQEQWIETHGKQTGASLVIGVGALLDFTAGEVKRAPKWVQNLRAEWIYRLVQEPKRMWKRYIVGNIKFLIRCFYFNRKV
jgi:alpha-1,3-mannosyltransferase